MTHVFDSPEDAGNLAGDEPDEDLGPWSPRIDVVEGAGITQVRADLPGLDPTRDLKVIARNGHLTIRGERREEIDRHSGTVIHAERRYGLFERSVPLPQDADTSGVRAEYRDGVLSVTIPRVG